MTGTPRLTPRFTALALVATLALPTVGLTAGCGNNRANNPPTVVSNPGPMARPNTAPMTNTQPGRQGMGVKQKVVLLAGAALLFYMYKRFQSSNNQAATAGANGQPQLYREEKGPNKGAIYYRKNDANHTVVWLSAPQQPVGVPQNEVDQYLPNYSQNPNAYAGQVNTRPQSGVMGGQVQDAGQYYGQYGNPVGAGGGMMGGPRGPMPSGPR